MLLLLACNEYGVTGEEKTEGAGPPAIEVQPLQVEFGEVALGESSDPVSIVIRSVGESILTVSGWALDGSTGNFSTSESAQVELAPEEEQRITARFAPLSSGASVEALQIKSDDPEKPVVEVVLTGTSGAPAITLTPESWDFGTLEPSSSDSVEVQVASTGASELTISGLRYESATGELSLGSDGTGSCGAFPWILAPGSSCSARVDYAPVDASADTGTLIASSDDPLKPEASATQTGNGKPFEGFSTGWYIVDDSTSYETTSNPNYVVDYHGDLDGYWYEPSGAHGLMGSADPIGDFAILRNYILARAGNPTPVSGPLQFDTASSVPALTWASYSWILCDFWLDTSDDPSRYSISSGSVDDGLLILMNGQMLGSIKLGESGSWPLSNAIPGQVNSLIFILMDNAEVNKYVHDLAFYKDGVMVQ